LLKASLLFFSSFPPIIFPGLVIYFSRSIFPFSFSLLSHLQFQVPDICKPNPLPCDDYRAKGLLKPYVADNLALRAAHSNLFLIPISLHQAQAHASAALHGVQGQGPQDGSGRRQGELRHQDCSVNFVFSKYKKRKPQ
jgi:hypothetical protein